MIHEKQFLKPGEIVITCIGNVSYGKLGMDKLQIMLFCNKHSFRSWVYEDNKIIL